MNLILTGTMASSPGDEKKRDLKGNENERIYYHKLLNGDNVLQEDAAFSQHLRIKTSCDDVRCVRLA